MALDRTHVRSLRNSRLGRSTAAPFSRCGPVATCRQPDKPFPLQLVPHVQTQNATSDESCDAAIKLWNHVVKHRRSIQPENNALGESARSRPNLLAVLRSSSRLSSSVPTVRVTRTHAVLSFNAMSCVCSAARLRPDHVQEQLGIFCRRYDAVRLSGPAPRVSPLLALVDALLVTCSSEPFWHIPISLPSHTIPQAGNGITSGQG